MEVFAEFKAALRSQGQMMPFSLRAIGMKPDIYVRSCYLSLFDDLLDLVSLGFTFIHISGNPGIGKSCFMWYVLVRLLNGHSGGAVIVQLPAKLNSKTFVFTPNGTVESADSPEQSPYCGQPGSWLLTDQEYVGSRAWRGVTVLFGSPNRKNWDEARFHGLWMPPWSVEELQVVFFRQKPRLPRSVREFWVRYYIAGPIARSYFVPLEQVFSELSQALVNVIRGGALDATLITDESHKIFCAWPADDSTKVARYTFISEWAELSYAIACYNGSIANGMKGIEELAADPQLRSVAGGLFARYAHYRLSRGGTFLSSDSEDMLKLDRRPVCFFDGNTLMPPKRKDFHRSYLRPNSSSFSAIDSVYLPDVMFQFQDLVSIAKERKPMQKSVFAKLCADLSLYRSMHPEVASGIQGCKETEPWIVFVKMRDDNSTESDREGLTLVEDVEDTDEVQAETERLHASRKRKRFVSDVKQTPQPPAAQKSKQKRTSIKPQMTIVLGDDEDETAALVDYRAKLQNIYDLVSYRLAGDDDPLHFRPEVGRSDELLNGKGCVHLLMRRGRSCKQYHELEGDLCVFGVWIQALREETADKVYKTYVDMECTVGTFLDEDREFDVFINERVGTELQYDHPVVFPVEPLVGMWTGVKTDQGNYSARFLNPTLINMTITSTTRECKYFRISIQKSST